MYNRPFTVGNQKDKSGLPNEANPEDNVKPKMSKFPQNLLTSPEVLRPKTVSYGYTPDKPIFGRPKAMIEDRGAHIDGAK